jgi:hypothetical protein
MPDTKVTLDAEHDRYEWIACSADLSRCRPERASAPLLAAVELIQGLR